MTGVLSSIGVPDIKSALSALINYKGGSAHGNYLYAGGYGKLMSQVVRSLATEIRKNTEDNLNQQTALWIILGLAILMTLFQAFIYVRASALAVRLTKIESKYEVLISP